MSSSRIEIRHACTHNLFSPLLAAKDPWESAFSQENCMKAWASIGVVPFTRCVYWDLLSAEAKAKETAIKNDLDPNLFTIQGMVKVMFGLGEADHDESGQARKRSKKDTLHSSDLWDMAGGATADECFGIVKAKTETRLAKKAATKAKKDAAAEKQKDAAAGLIALGASIVALLTDATHIPKLVVAQLKAVLAFKAVDHPKTAKKDALVYLAEAALSLPSASPAPPMPSIPSQLPTPTPTTVAAPVGAVGPSCIANEGEGTTAAHDEGEGEEDSTESDDDS